MIGCLPRIPLRYRVLNEAARRLALDRLPSVRFLEETLSESACRAVGLADFGDPHYREGLTCLLKSLEGDADLSAIGRFGIHGMLVTLLTNRLLMAEARKRELERFNVDLHPPIFILGMPRSGTTFLHRLLAADPGNRTIPMWRLFRPIRREPDEVSRRRLDKALERRRRLTPELDRKHYTRADSAEECIWLMNATFVSHGFWAAAPVYGYLDWLAEGDRTAAYREYATMLRYFQSESPDRRLLLKAPQHSGSLEALWEAIPRARIIQLHRDPLEVCASMNSLFYSLHSAVVRRIDISRMAEANVRLLAHEMELNRKARMRRPDSVLDLFHRDLVEDPIGTAELVYRRFGLEWNAEVAAGVRRFAAANPRGRHGRHSYDLSDFGLDATRLARIFEPYRTALGFTR
jgi:hypothetical protein